MKGKTKPNYKCYSENAYSEEHRCVMSTVYYLTKGSPKWGPCANFSLNYSEEHENSFYSEEPSYPVQFHDSEFLSIEKNLLFDKKKTQ